jgi:hypothetical protein
MRTRVSAGLRSAKLLGFICAALLCGCALSTSAQEPTATPTPTPTPLTTPTTAPAPAPHAAPLYKEFKGVRLGMTTSEVRQKLGKPEEASKGQDFFVFSDSERARAYYDEAQHATAIIVTYIGKSANAPTPEAILGRAITAKPDGSLYDMVQYPEAGYWVAYSRTGGDNPLTIITMQKMLAIGK